ncbi:MAG: hypothetical protein JXL97_08230, partial [Bacteroidales bacterium]|nr:hypothetical protein [Bacteroidales bacterium]
MKKVFIVFSILLSFNFSYSQNVILERKIEWTTKKTNEFNKTKDNELWFSNATLEGDVPVYQESINLNKVGIFTNNVSVKIIPIETETTNLSLSDYDFKNIQLESSIYSGRDIPYLILNLKPFVEKNGRIEKLITFKIEIKPLAQKSNSKTTSFVSNSVLNSGNWLKIGIPQRGVYKLTYSELESLGFSSPANVRVFGNDKGMLSHWNNDFSDDDLIENTIYKGSDFILFFAEGPEKWTYNETTEMFDISKNTYCDTAYYFLTDKNTGFANSIQNSENSTQTSTATISDYYYNDVVEEDLINILHSGRIWLGESFLYGQQKTYSFDVPNIIAGQPGKIKISNAVRSSLNSSFSYSFSGVTKTESFSSVSGVHYLLYADYQNNYYDFNQVAGTLNVGVNFNKPTSSSEAWLDKIIINVKRSLAFYEQMTFRSLENIGATNYSKFQMSSASSNVLIWDVTEPTAPKNQSYSISSSTIAFTTKTDTTKEFIAFTTANCLTPVYEGNGLGTVANQDLHNIPVSTDMIVVAPKIFETQAEQFAEIHRTHDNYNVVVALTDEIYNEFGSGSAGAPQIRNYLKMAYEKTGHNLKYVLLLGDGTYNNFGETTSFNPNYIPTYETLNSFNSSSNISTTTDDFYALLDEDEGEYTGKLDIAVGRLPVKTTDEADAMVA